MFGIEDFLPSDEVTHLLASLVCPVPDLDVVCGNVLFLIGGYDVPNMNFVRACLNFEYTEFNMVFDTRAVLLFTLDTALLGPL